MLKTILFGTELISVAVPYTPLCVDCGGVRSYGSGQRCKRCFLALAVQKRQARQEQRLRAADNRIAAAALRHLREIEKEARIALRKAASTEKREALLLAQAERRTAQAARRVSRRSKQRQGEPFQRYTFRTARHISASKVFKDALSLDAPCNNDRRFGAGTLADSVADPAPNVLERMVAAEGVSRVIQRLADEAGIPAEQARQIVESLVDSDLLEEGSVFDLAELLRGGWQADRLLNQRSAKHRVTLVSSPTIPNPEPHQYQHWRRKYALGKSGRVITRDTEPVSFGGSWSVETALPEEIEKIT